MVHAKRLLQAFEAQFCTCGQEATGKACLDAFIFFFAPSAFACIAIGDFSLHDGLRDRLQVNKRENRRLSV